MKMTRFVLMACVMCAFALQVHAEKVQLTADEEKVVEKFKTYIVKNCWDTQAMNKVVDNNTFADLVLQKSAIDANNQKMLRGILQRGLLAQSMVSALQKIEAGYSYRGVEKQADSLFLCFRVDMLGINYHTYVIEKVNDEYKIVDLSVMNLGERMSSVLRQQFEKVMIMRDPNADPAKKKEAQLLIKHLPDSGKMTELRIEGKFEEAMKLYQSLPEVVRENKIFIQSALTVASVSDDEMYIKLLKRYQELYGGDGSLDLMLIDAHMISKDYDKMLASLDKISKRSYNNPVLNAYRVIGALAKKDVKKANEYVKELEEKEPSNTFVWVSKVRIACNQSDYKEATKQLIDLLDKQEIYYVDLNDKELFNAYAESEEAKAYIAKRDAYIKQLQLLQ